MGKYLNTTFPGSYNTKVIYGGMLMTPESLGNFTYGYLGAAFGISYQTLIYGSIGAAVLPKSNADVFNESGDWNYIAMGLPELFLLKGDMKIEKKSKRQYYICYHFYYNYCYRGIYLDFNIIYYTTR